MIHQITPVGTSSPLWDSTPIGRSIYLHLCQHEQLSPQLIIEDKVFRSEIRLQNNCSQIHFIGTLISDDESQRLTYVIDRLLLTDSTPNHQLLTGEFLIPIQYDNKSSSVSNTLIQDGINEIERYCHSSLPIEMHRFSYLCGQMFSRHTPSVNVDLSFDLLTIKNSFTLTPINPDYVQILPTALLKNLSSSTGNNVYNNQPHFGYCSLDRMLKNKILLILENDPQSCTLPLVGIWISGIADIQCPFVWATCIHYCMNSTLKQRLRSGIQSFLLACYLPSSRGQSSFYEVNLVPINSVPSLTMDYDLWTCSRKITLPNLPSHQYDTNYTTQFPYDFQFKRVHDLGRVHSGKTSIPIQHQTVQSTINTRVPMDLSFLSAEILPLPNTNGSLFGFPRIPPKQSTHQSPSWDSISTTPIKTLKRIARPSPVSPKSTQSSSPAPVTDLPDTRWKEELIERMHSYETHIQSLTTLVSQLLATQKQPSSISTPIKESTKRDVAIQSEPTSPYRNDHVDELLSINKSNHHCSPSPKIEHCQQQQPPIISIPDQSSSTQFQSLLPQLVTHQDEPLIGFTTDQSISSPPPSVSTTDLNPVDILKPIFQFIDNQQQKQQQQQQQESTSSLKASNNSNDTTLLTVNDDKTDGQTGNMFHLANVIPQQQQQHVTSTRTTGISFISNGVQMQFINQQSSTTTVYPQAQLTPPPNDLLPTSPQKSENNLSIEVHGLEMKYLEDEQLAAAIECDRQSQATLNKLPPTSQFADITLSFETQEYLRRYGLLTDPNK